MDVVAMRVASKRGGGLMSVREIWIWDLYATFGGWRDGRVGWQQWGNEWGERTRNLSAADAVGGRAMNTWMPF
jgi:hypothetical protein